MAEYTNQICGISLPENSTNQCNEETIELTIAIFFDGTKNNKYNTTFGKEKDDSYKGSYTNVAELYEHYKTDSLTEKVYIEGIATAPPKNGMSTGKKDCMRGAVWGTGKYGINKKIERGCIEVKKAFTELKKKNGYTSVDSLIINVFGFSRGAAAARSFVSRIKTDIGTNTDKCNVCLRKYIKESDAPSITVQFLGLFDTVSSYSPGWTLAAFDEKDVEELNLKIPSMVKQTVHIVAADEYRKYFALTTIKSADSNASKELVIPGAHSDIGGGYMQPEAENILMSGYDIGDRKCRGYKSLQQLYDECWLPKDWYTEKDTFMKNGTIQKYRDRNRYVKNDYSKVALSLMSKYVTEAKLQVIEKLADKYKIESWMVNLCNIQERVLSVECNPLYKICSEGVIFVGSNEDMEKICSVRSEYIHLSSYNSLGHYATSNNKRLIYEG